MKPMLHLKTALLVAYVALCTHLVLTVLEAEPDASGVQLAQLFSD